MAWELFVQVKAPGFPSLKLDPVSTNMAMGQNPNRAPSEHPNPH